MATARSRRPRGSLLVAADGIHSVVRSARYPDEGMPKWNGALLWRGLAEAPPVLGGRTMIWAGHPDQKFVGYPIADLPDGRQLFNFIAELRIARASSSPSARTGTSPACSSDFIDRFESWRFPWLDVPALIRSSSGTFRFPMVDRDPVERWSFGRTTLLGDAAHPMYPIGSNGASQAILDARVLTACLRCHPDDPVRALERYDEERRPATGAIVLANRGFGPELPMKLVEERAPDGFADIADVITPDEIAEVTDGYRRTAGFALAALADGAASPTAPTDVDATVQHDVAIVGFGPVGQTLAALLGTRGHRVVAIEKFAEIYPLPRAVRLDGEIMRTFQQLGIVGEIEHELVAGDRYVWYGADGGIILDIPTTQAHPSGWSLSYLFHQPTVEAALDARAAARADGDRGARLGGRRAPPGRRRRHAHDAAGRRRLRRPLGPGALRGGL